MPVTPADLVAELTILLRLTGSDEAVARLRSRLQARDPKVAQELSENADKARERRHLLEQALSDLGAPRDLLSPVLGAVTVLIKSQAEQLTTFGSALLTDLALQHQLRERARFARELARTLDKPSVIAVLDRLDLAHTATIEWIEQRLAEVAAGQPSALRATPVQVAVSAARRTAFAPLTAWADLTSRLVDLSHGLRGGSHGLASRAAGARERLAGRLPLRHGAAADPRGQDDGRVDAQSGARADAGAGADTVVDLRETQLPIKSYGSLTGDMIIRHLADMDDLEEIRAVLDYERRNKARKGVLGAAEKRLNDLEQASA